MSNWRHILVWEVSTIAIPGQRLLERCESNFGDVHATARHPQAGKQMGAPHTRDQSPSIDLPCAVSSTRFLHGVAILLASDLYSGVDGGLIMNLQRGWILFIRPRPNEPRARCGLLAKRYKCVDRVLVADNPISGENAFLVILGMLLHSLSLYYRCLCANGFPVV